ncbi:cytochrome c oxidase assembly protein [Virgibacillus salexigens]|uniref:cytochrome c oxidase assembly protein n=1 Tax=Virgibacillus kapii TaxID=1638645 RepID=UPI001666F525|nr:cytochrome c oxidase assembly protein [Virgibacillus kapii]
MNVETFLFLQEWNMQLLLILICCSIVYVILSWKKGNFFKSVLFFSSMLILYITIGSPLSALGHISFSTHMIQMSIVYFIIPPLLVRSFPKRSSSTKQFTAKPIKIMTMLALILFAVMFFLYHLPITLQYLAVTPTVRRSYQFLLFLLAVVMWWPIIASEAREYFNKQQKQRYTFISSMIIMPACLLFIIYALFDGASNPLASQAATQWCIPASTTQQNSLLPFSINTKLDQWLAGLSMLGIHKMSLHVSSRMDEKVNKSKSSPRSISL